MFRAGLVDIAANSGRSADKIVAGFARSHPIGRLAQDSNIANAVVFLSSEAAGMMTGAELVVDGGLTAM